jgi:Predicted membrane protein
MCVTTLSQAKAMGGVGSILVLLSFVPSVGFVLGIVGLVLVLIAVKQISDAVKDREIFNNVLMAVILQVVGIGILAFAVLVGLLSSFAMAPSLFAMTPFGSPFDGFGGPGLIYGGEVFLLRDPDRWADRDVDSADHRCEVPQEGIRADRCHNQDGDV